MDLGFALVFDPCNTCSKKNMCLMCELTFRRKGAVANSATTTSEWISVEERLPELYTYVITYDTVSGDVQIDSVLSNGEFVIGYNVTHWMPLPEAPKKGGGE